MNRQPWSSSTKDWKIFRTTAVYLQWKILDAIFPKVKKYCSLLYVLVIFRAMKSHYAAGSWHLLFAALCQDLWQSSLGFCFGTGSITLVMCFWNCRIDSSREDIIAKYKGVVELIWINSTVPMQYNFACFPTNYQGVRLTAVIILIVKKIQLLYVVRLYETGRSLMLVQDTSLLI